MTEKKVLIDWIHKIELAKSQQGNNLNKRLNSIVIELFFEKFLASGTLASLPKKLSFGWAYHFTDRNKNRRQWFKISEGNPDSKSVGQNFVRQILSKFPSDRFFLLNPEVSFSGNAPSVAWNVQEIKLAENRLTRDADDTGAQSLECKLSSLVGIKLQEASKLSADNYISPWLSQLSNDELEKLFVTRCLMNFSDLYLRDIDAIGVDGDELELIEFKRKYPAKGVKYTHVSNGEEPASLSQYLAKAYRLTSNAIDHNAELKGNQWKRHKEPSYGLDTSHVDTLQLCIEAGIRYRYIIWNSSKTQPCELLSDTFKPKEAIDLHWRHMNESSFNGLSFTTGKDSGSYTENTRFQLMTAESTFNKVEIKP